MDTHKVGEQLIKGSRMLGNLRLWAKILLAMGSSVVIVILALTATNLRTMTTLVDEAETRELADHVKAVTQAIAAQSRMAEALAAFVAALPPVQDRFAAGDRAGLGALLLPAYKATAQRFGIEQFQFHTPPAIAFLRLHKPEKFGDDLSSFRRTVVNTNKTLAPTRGLESGVAGLGIRGVVPVESAGRHTGSVEFGLAFDQGFFDAFKERQGVDLALHLVADQTVTTFGSTLGKDPLSTSSAILKAAGGEPQLSHVDVAGKPLAVYAAPLQDYSGATIGVIEVAMDRSRYIAGLSAARTTSLLVGGLVLLVGIALALTTASHLSRRIFTVMRGVDHVAQGDLTGDIVVDGTDELGQLAEAAGRMRSQLHDLASGMKQHAGQVHAAARDITESVEGQAAASSEMSASVAQITATMEELSSSSIQIAEYSGSVVDIANLTYESSKKGSEAMQSVTAHMTDIQTDNQHNLREILELGNRSKEISRVMTIINTIADQTKLIAFNAALEAASAGEAGRRFGVVAAEIRRLADNVTESTGEIEGKIGQIQDSISRLVIASEKGANGIASGMESAAHSTDSLTELVDAAHRTTNAAQQISLSTQQQRTASSQVVVALREIVTASTHTAQSITRISEISREMARLSAGLDGQLNRFRLRDTG